MYIFSDLPKHLSYFLYQFSLFSCGEMAMADAITNAAAAEWALVRKHSSEDIFGVQICGNNPYVLSKCGQLLEDTTEIDFIDLNLGCPIDLVKKTKLSPS